MPDDSYGAAAVSPSPLPPPESSRMGLPLSQTQWIILSMIVGVLVGYLFPDGPDSRGLHATDLQVVSSVFLRMIKSLIAPLLFGTLVAGIAGHGNDLKRVGKLAFRSILYFEIATSLALVVGLLVVNVVKPGIGVNLAAAAADTGVDLAHTTVSFSSVLEHAVPHSIFDAAARNDSLQITFFAIIFAVALSQTRGQTRSLVLSFCESLSEVMFKLVNVIMKFAPLGIGAAIAVTVSRGGLGVLEHLGVLVLCLYGGVILFAIAVLLPIGILFKVPIRQFWEATREPSIIAFTTASSEAALPLALRNIERFGVPRHIASFVLPTGYAFNMDGTTLYLAIASVFVAQAAGIDMSLWQQILMMLTLMLTSKGLAGVPRASLVILSGTLVQFGLPLQGVAIILGVDALMDMARTSLNVIGNCLAAVLLARWDRSLELPASHNESS